MRRLAFVLLAMTACQPGPDIPPETDSATRIVTLAPHLAELVFAAGAGDSLVGVSAFSNYPDAVLELPVIGDAFTVDQEQLALLEPDLLLAWKSGTPTHVVDELRAIGYRVEVVETRGLQDISSAIDSVGELAGTGATAREASLMFRESLTALQLKYADRERLRVFYQVSQRPLYTISGQHYIGEILRLCGGVNIFEDVGDLAPAVTVEAVLDRDPQVLLAGSADGSKPFDDWRRWPGLAANTLGAHFVVNADEIGRPTPRVIRAANSICEAFDEARGLVATRADGEGNETSQAD